jgi:hypothetical protein
MATLSVLRPVSEPIGTQSVCQLLRMWDKVRRFCGDEGTEEYPVRTRWLSEQGSALAYAVTEWVRLGSRTTYAAPGFRCSMRSDVKSR